MNKVNRFLKYISLLLVFLLMVTLGLSCKKDNDELDLQKKITIYTVNDFHGAIKEKASLVGDYLINAKDENSVIISAGDMFQGSALSNYSYGLDMVNLMNMMSFDSMTVGNHEFDWSLDTVLNYFDGDDTNGEANFSLLGCNVIDKRTNTLPINMQPYEIITRNDLNIGIIGYMGLGLESDITESMVANYEFIDPTTEIRKYSKELRTTKDVDIVIAVGHDASTLTNRNISNLSDDERVDAIVNGHTHVNTKGVNRRISDEVKVPYVQAGSSGEYVGIIELTYSMNEQKVIDGVASSKKIKDTDSKNEKIQKYVDDLVENTSSVFEKVIGYAGCDVNNVQGIRWACNSILKYCQDNYLNCDVAFTNTGGIREAAFPINKDEAITVERIYQMMPFDNAIKLVTIKGNVLRSLIQNKGELAYSEDSVTVSGASIYIHNELLNDELEYRVAIVDYIFDKDSYPFKKGTNVVTVDKILRDILIVTIEIDNANERKSFI